MFSTTVFDELKLFDFAFTDSSLSLHPGDLDMVILNGILMDIYILNSNVLRFMFFLAFHTKPTLFSYSLGKIFLVLFSRGLAVECKLLIEIAGQFSLGLSKAFLRSGRDMADFESAYSVCVTRVFIVIRRFLKSDFAVNYRNFQVAASIFLRALRFDQSVTNPSCLVLIEFGVECDSYLAAKHCKLNRPDSYFIKDMNYRQAVLNSAGLGEPSIIIATC